MIYFARMAGRGPIKIGCTKFKLRYRLHSLKEEYGVPFRLLAATDGYFKEEKALHRRFKKDRLLVWARSAYRRELFFPSKELFAFIREVKAERPPNTFQGWKKVALLEGSKIDCTVDLRWESRLGDIESIPWPDEWPDEVEEAFLIEQGFEVVGAWD